MITKTVILQVTYPATGTYANHGQSDVLYHHFILSIHTGHFIIYDTITKFNNFTHRQRIIFIYISYCS